MIFSYTHEKIMNESKTVTRRVCIPGDNLGGDPPAVYRKHKKNGLTYPAWRVGNTYAVQPGRGKREVCRIRIIDIGKELVTLEITPKEIALEGYPGMSPDEYVRMFLKINAHQEYRGWDGFTVWRIQFEKVKERF